MATTNQIAAWIVGAAAGYSRSSDVIPIINEVHSLLCKQEVGHFLIIDPTTGRPPTFDTVAGTYQYTAPTVGSGASLQTPWRVANVLRLVDDLVNYDYRYHDYGFDQENVSEYIEIGGRYYYPYFQCQAYDRIDSSSPARIIFSSDPQTTSGRFYVQEYREPRAILSDRIQLEIPDVKGAHRALFFPACMKYIEGINHGNYEEAIKYIDEEVSPKIRDIFNGGAKGRRHRTMPRPY